MPNTQVHGMQVHGKRKLYMILLYAGLQPLLIWWMTSYLVAFSSPDLSVPGSGDNINVMGTPQEDPAGAAVPGSGEFL